jgi:hypothetical protein
MKTLSKFSSILLLFTTPCVHSATSVTQHGITWHFDQDYEIGQYANGDYYVVEKQDGLGVTITGTTPKFENTDTGWSKNGSMVNPSAGRNSKQGFDSSTSSYSSDLNLGKSLPLAIATDSSFLTAVSKSTPNNRPQLKTFAILTVTDVHPPEGSFRPPYAGSDKTIRGNYSNLDYNLLPRLAKPNNGVNVPRLEKVEAYFQLPWYELQTSWVAQNINPSDNMPNYGREIAYKLEEGMLSLLLDYSNKEKQTLYIRLVQYGIDIYGAAKSGGYWKNDGGHSHGRKAILLLAAKALNDSEMLGYCDTSKKNLFGEDHQTFYVTQKEIDLTNSDKWNPDTRNGSPSPYSQDDLGVAEWGIQHNSAPHLDNKAWSAIYREIVGASQIGLILAARILELEDDWKHPAIFDYFDRYWEAEKNAPTGRTNQIKTFTHEMWQAHRYGTRPNHPSNLKAIEIQ